MSHNDLVEVRRQISKLFPSAIWFMDIDPGPSVWEQILLSTKLFCQSWCYWILMMLYQLDEVVLVRDVCIIITFKLKTCGIRRPNLIAHIHGMLYGNYSEDMEEIKNN